MSKSTPGPWVVNLHSDGSFQIENTKTGENYIPICGRSPWSETTQSHANARLISAAPELLVCCEASLSYLLLEEHLDKTQLIIELRRVIAKAQRGES